MAKNYDEGAVVQQLRLKNDINITSNNQIQRLFGNQAKGDVGIGSKGKIDFLRKLGYIEVFVTKFDRR